MPSGLLVAFWAILGAAVGSFLNVVADRLPNQISILSPPSHCGVCDRRLGSADMVPVLSYLALRGRCQSCGAAIGQRVLWTELGTGLLFALAAWRTTPAGLEGWTRLLLTSASLAVLVVITVIDLEHGLILNRISHLAIVLGVIGALPTGWPDMLRYLGAGLLGAGLIVLIIILVPGGMGWGDVYLTGFVGLVTGLPGLLFALFIAFVSGGLVAGALLVSGRRRRGDKMPLGPFLALGGGVTLLYGEEMLRAFYTLAARL